MRTKNLQFLFHSVRVGAVGVRLTSPQCVKGGGARKMLQTAKTFVTKLVRYIEWIVDPLWGHQFYLIWYCYGQKRPFFLAKTAVFGHERLQTPQMAGKSGSNGGSQLNTCRRTNLGAKLVRITHPVVWKWLQSGPFGAKNAIFWP